MEIKTVHYPDEINIIIKNDWIYDRTTDDRCPGKDLLNTFFPYDEWDFYGGYIDNQIFGLVYVHESEYGPMVHIQVLPEFREHALEFAIITRDLIISDYGELWAQIPTLYQDVLHFSRKVGFKDVKIKEKSYLKNGIKYDEHVLVYR